MIRPANFAANPETAASNVFQQPVLAGNPREVAETAVREFDELVSNLRRHGVNVRVFDDTMEPVKPDAAFPNNWLSTHADGTVVLYAMQAESRRRERRLDMLTALAEEENCRVTRLVDFSAHEIENRFLEGTGSLVLDRLNRIAFACLSPRTDGELVEQWSRELDYQAVVFEATAGPGNTAIYHTNVLLCMGTEVAIASLDCINDGRDRDRVATTLKDCGRQLVELSREQVLAFAGNMLELLAANGEQLLVMSTSAHASLEPEQREFLQSFYRLVITDIPIIERCAGGSVRCMIAENFLPMKGTVTSIE